MCFALCVAGGKLSHFACHDGLKVLCKRAGLEKVGWHTLHHTFAAHLVMAEVPLPSVQQLLGHVDIKLTMRYAHLSQHVGVEAVRRLSVAYANGVKGEKGGGG
jgi:site-specific recombinase XerD